MSQAAITTSALILQSLRLFRLPSYELFLRSHQAVALGAAYAIWKHATSRSKLPRLCVYISTGIFLATSVLQCLVVLYWNFSFRQGHSRALISKHRGSVRMTIDFPKSLEIKAGQYVNVWIPSISFWSFLQSHPFTIAAWGNNEGTTSLDLLIEPRKGFTQKLYACAENYSERPGKGTDVILQEPAITAIESHESTEQEGRSTAIGNHRSQEKAGRTEVFQRPFEEAAANAMQSKFGYKNYEGEPQSSDFRLAIFSGPHGTGVPVGDYGKVLMIAVGFGIAAQLPYLKELVRGFNNYQVRTREVRLIWQLQSFGKSTDYCLCRVDWPLDDRRPASELIDRVLKEDTDTNGYVSVFLAGYTRCLLLTKIRYSTSKHTINQGT